MNRKVRVYGKINLYETSAVGLPAYPDAHFNASLSLTKSLSHFINEGEELVTIKYEEENQMETETVKSETIETKAVEVAVEKNVEAKEDVNALIAKAIKDGVKETLKEIETERALVAKEKDQNTTKSIGELTLEMFRRDMR